MSDLDEVSYRLTAFRSSDHPKGGNVRTPKDGFDTVGEAAQASKSIELYDGEELYIEKVDEIRDRVMDRIDPNEVL